MNDEDRYYFEKVKIHDLIDELIERTTGHRAKIASWRASSSKIIIRYELNCEHQQKHKVKE